MSILCCLIFGILTWLSLIFTLLSSNFASNLRFSFDFHLFHLKINIKKWPTDTTFIQIFIFYSKINESFTKSLLPKRTLDILGKDDLSAMDALRRDDTFLPWSYSPHDCKDIQNKLPSQLIAFHQVLHPYMSYRTASDIAGPLSDQPLN